MLLGAEMRLEPPEPDRPERSVIDEGKEGLPWPFSGIGITGQIRRQVVSVVEREAVFETARSAGGPLP